MSADIQNLSVLIVVLFVVLLFTWLVSGRMRIALETLFFMIISIIITIYATMEINPTTEGDYVLLALVPSIFIILYGFRFNTLFKNPFKDVITQHQRVLNSRDLTFTKKRYTKSFPGEMMKLLDIQKESLSSLHDIIKHFKSKEMETTRISSDFSETTISFGSDISNVVNNVGEVSQTINILEELLEQANSSIQNLVQEVKKQIISVNEAVEDTDRISDQTNLIAVNAAIEAAHSGIHGENFGVVAEGIQKLSSRSRKSTDKLYESIKIINEYINEEFPLLINDFLQLNQLTTQIGKLTDKISSLVKHYEAISRILIDYSGTLQNSSTNALDYIQSYSI